jgi:hypothetical protein
MLGGLANEVGPMASPLASFDRGAITNAARSAHMDIQNNNVGLREAAAGRQIPNRNTPGLRTLR